MKKHILYLKEICPFCKKVLRVIDKYHIEGIEIRDIKKDPGAQAELLEKGGKDQVPMLLIDGEPLYESGDIIQYLKENFVS
ncbi:MAG: NrdH-redoxin [Tissierellia bacterium]|jgi:glutaredoxin 3|nr:glutaredoxin domain-containing protein [Bacillota bacterium]NLK59167.1 NrdH-redoxin [Tissierellia bacterium]